MPFISVVIPAYNSADYIEDTLRSLYNQTDKNFEVVIVDDGSTDNTFALAQEYMKTFGLTGRVLVRPADQKKGVSSSRNYGVANSQGDWISFLDSDDTYFPDKIKVAYEKINEFGDTCFIYEHAAQFFEDKTNITLSYKVKDSFLHPLDYSRHLLNDLDVATSSITLKKSMFNDLNGFDTMLQGVEDSQLWLRISKRTLWYYSNDVLSGYRVRAESLSHGKKFGFMVNQKRKLINSVKKTNEFTSEEIAMLTKYMLDDSSAFYASETLNNYGFGAFINGLWELFKFGKRKQAIGIFATQIKFFALKKASAILKKGK
jgi:glycosyltransferase involved in cell wall biosynthesis